MPAVLARTRKKMRARFKGVMSMKAKILYLIVGLVAAIFTIHVFSYGGPSFFYNWHSIKIGDSKSEVLSKLGVPFKESTEFEFWEMNPHQENAKEAGSEIYLTWVKSIDIGFVIGFNQQQKVTYKVSGGS